MTKADTKNEADIQLPRGYTPKHLPLGIDDPENGS